MNYDDYYTASLPPVMLSSADAGLLAQLNDNSEGQTVGTEKSTIVGSNYTPSTFTAPPPSSTTIAPRKVNETGLMILIAIIVAWHLLQD